MKQYKFDRNYLNLLIKNKDKLLDNDLVILITYIEILQKQLADIKFYIEQSDIKDMLWGKEMLKIIGGNDE